MPRDWWNPKEVAGMRNDRRYAKFKIVNGKVAKKQKAKQKLRAENQVKQPRAPGAALEFDKAAFYKSIQWRQLRYLALRNSGGCNCCGAKASDGVYLHIDHIKPISRYPELRLSLDNVQVLCEDCNVGKGSWDETDWR